MAKAHIVRAARAKLGCCTAVEMKILFTVSNSYNCRPMSLYYAVSDITASYWLKVASFFLPHVYLADVDLFVFSSPTLMSETLLFAALTVP